MAFKMDGLCKCPGLLYWSLSIPGWLLFRSCLPARSAAPKAVAYESHMHMFHKQPSAYQVFGAILSTWSLTSSSFHNVLFRPVELPAWYDIIIFRRFRELFMLPHILSGTAKPNRCLRYWIIVSVRVPTLQLLVLLLLRDLTEIYVARQSFRLTFTLIEIHCTALPVSSSVFCCSYSACSFFVHPSTNEWTMMTLYASVPRLLPLATDGDQCSFSEPAWERSSLMWDAHRELHERTNEVDKGSQRRVAWQR